MSKERMAVLIPDNSVETIEEGHCDYTPSLRDWTLWTKTLGDTIYIDAGLEDLYPNQIVVLQKTDRKVRAAQGFIDNEYYWEIVKDGSEQDTTD